MNPTKKESWTYSNFLKQEDQKGKNKITKEALINTRLMHGVKTASQVKEDQKIELNIFFKEGWKEALEQELNKISLLCQEAEKRIPTIQEND